HTIHELREGSFGGGACDRLRRGSGRERLPLLLVFPSAVAGRLVRSCCNCKVPRTFRAKYLRWKRLKQWVFKKKFHLGMFSRRYLQHILRWSGIGRPSPSFGP